MCQGFNHFSGFLDHFVKAKLATSSIRVKEFYMEVYIPVSPSLQTGELMNLKDTS